VSASDEYSPFSSETFDEIRADAIDACKPHPSRPTTAFGAPDLGLDWAWNWGQPAAHRAFGEDNDTEDSE
jgi:hypothetical protein